MINKITKVVMLLVAVLGLTTVLAEGSFQAGLNQPLRDYDASNERLFVDIMSAGEVINVHLCGDKDSDDVRVKIYDPSNNLILDTSRTEGTISCADPLNSPLSNAIKYTSTAPGAYALELDNNGDSGDRFNLRRVDVTVTADTSIDPDPSVAVGRLWSRKWTFDAGTFDEGAATNADYYPLVPGGRANTNYVWKLDLNKFSGFVYEIIANDIGVDAPRAGYSTLIVDNDVKTKFPIYLGYPAVAKPRPSEPPVINTFRFIDNAGQDYVISPAVTTGVQDSGVFEFISDIEGSFSIIIDSNNDTIYDADDVQLLGKAVIGNNQISWDGTDVKGNVLPAGNYRSRLSLRMGEYHFIGRDVETSGGPSNDGLTIYLADSNGGVTDTRVYWDDKTFLNGSSTLPDGALSSSAAGKHTWGDFSSLSIGNISFMDTYVYGLSSTDVTLVGVSTSDGLLAGVDGVISVSSERSNPGDTLTAIVNDADLNLNPALAESIVIRIINSRSAEVEQIALTETGIDSGMFSGALGTVNNAIVDVNNNGTMNVQIKDVLTLTYQDQLNAASASETKTITHTIGTADAATTTLDASPLSIVADGVSTSLITVQLKDSSGNDVPVGGDSLVLSTTAGTLGAVTDKNNGTYTALLTSSSIVEMATVSGSLNGSTNMIIATVTVAFSAIDDADGDGIPDTAEGTGDADSDGIPDYQDVDSDNDGIPDSIDRNIDSDNDGVPNYKDLDSDNDGVLDAVEGSVDTDSDGLADYLDLDSDNDGITDIREAGGVDQDGDGRVDNFTGGNADGLDDTIAATPLADTDSDKDTIPDRLELDSDNDAIKDLVEAGGPDSNNDGLVDGFTDNNNDGLDDSLAINPLPVSDTDKDGVLDYRDLDSDNDGVPDAKEGIVDTDLDSVPDYHDLDSDNDGIPDVTEAGGKNSTAGMIADPVDTDGDGLDDALASIPLADRDSDNDGIPDRRDLDSDKDTVNDLLEAGGVDGNNDGLVDGFTDINGDGYDDMLSASPLIPPDTDNDGIDDYQDNDDFDNDGIADNVDLDDDNDGIPDSIEGSSDTDGDGIADSLELDSDNDGINDLVEAGGLDSNNDGMIDTPVDVNADGLDDAIASSPLPDTDSDRDGLPDRTEQDSDNDGIPDSVEGVVDTDSDGLADYRDLDSDNDGIPDANEGNVDTDNDGIKDYRDLDSDNDAVPDIMEASGSDSNGDGRVDNLIDADGDGLDDSIASQPLADRDTDSDGKPDRQDLDSDNDGIFDLVEAGGTDNNNDGLIDAFSDNNRDGLDDTIAESPLVPPDSNSDGIPDFQENDKGIVTGINGIGGGCSLSTHSSTDPMLPMLLLISIVVMTSRIRKRNRN